MSKESLPGRCFMLGDLCVDLVLQIPDELGNARQQPEPEVCGGGTVGNAAVGLARLGIETHFVGVVGDDLFGRQVAQELVAEGIDISCLEYSRSRPTMVVMALIDGSGQRTVFGWPRRDQAFAELNSELVSKVELRAKDWLHTTGVCMVQPAGCHATLAMLEVARQRGNRTSFDLNLRLGLEGSTLPQSYIENLWRAIDIVDFVLGSVDEELLHLIPDEPNARVATERLAHRGNCIAIMREGSAGAHVSKKGAPTVTIPAFDVPVVDTLGAGDAFNAGFIQAGLERRDLYDQVLWGHATAGLQIGGTGARSSPASAEVENLLSLQGN